MDNMIYSSFSLTASDDKAVDDASVPAYFRAPICEQEYGVNVNEIRPQRGESMTDCGVAAM